MRVAGVELKDARVMVIGMARSGVAAAKLLSAEGAGVTACDAREAAAIEGLGALDFRLQSADVCLDQQLVVISPGVPAGIEPLVRARAAGIPVIGEMELAGYFLKGNIAAITGSNGKTTTTSLVGHILGTCGIACQVGGNIGTPPAAMVASSRADQWSVLEVSSFQTETISRFRAHIAVALNLTPDHLDRHGTMEAYAAAKGRLFQTQQPEDFAVLNADDPACLSYASLSRGRPVWFSLTRAVTPGLWVDRGTILFDGEPLMETAGIPLRGRHNVENVLAAAATARLAGAELKGIAEAVRSFPGVEHRLEFARRVNGVEYFNDSKATNVDAALKAIDAFTSGLWIILGGKDKNSDYRPLREPLRNKARAALLVGAAAEKIAEQLEGAVPLEMCGTLASAVKLAAERAQPGDTVLLAPACASFDQFESFEHRGRVFKQTVRGLSGNDL